MNKRIALILAAILMLCAACPIASAPVCAESNASVQADIAEKCLHNVPKPSDFVPSDAALMKDVEATNGEGFWVSETTGGTHYYNNGDADKIYGINWKGTPVDLDGFYVIFSPFSWDSSVGNFFSIRFAASATASGDSIIDLYLNTGSGSVKLYTDGNGSKGQLSALADIVKNMTVYTTMIAIRFDAQGAPILSISNSNGESAERTMPEGVFSAFSDPVKAIVGFNTYETDAAFTVDILSLYAKSTPYTVDGTDYATLAEALAAAPGKTVKLSDDVKTDELAVTAGATLDLNGHSVEAAHINVTGNLIDTAAEKGIIKATGDTAPYFFAQTETALPVYDAKRGGYALYSVEPKSGAIANVANKYGLYLDETSTDFADAVAAIQAGGCVRAVAVARWEDSAAKPHSYRFTFSDALMATYLENAATKMFFITFLGLDKLDMVGDLEVTLCFEATDAAGNTIATLA